MRVALLMASVVALAACSSPDLPTELAHGADPSYATGHNTPLRSPVATRQPRAVAGLPDHGTLVAYTKQTAVKQSAYTWHPVQISEAHALRAIASGQMTIEAPDGTPIRLEYDHHIEHPDGNWTWVGRPAGAKPGTEAIITFGEKAVFGTVPNRGRKPLRIGSSHGHAWVMETDEKLLQSVPGARPEGPDFAVPPALAGARERAMSMAAAQPQRLTAAGAVPESATIDVVIGYTNSFASRLGSTSAAITRLTFLTDVTNQAFTNSQVVARIRLAGTVALAYPDATDNQAALRELTGVTCTELPNGSLDCNAAPVPAALMPLVNLRESRSADLMSLVRNFSEPENQGCGIAWMLGGGMAGEISPAEVAYYGVSVVSDSNGNGDTSQGNPGPTFPDDGYVCRDETFAHEVGHNLGSQHDSSTAMGDDGVLDDHDRGVFRYSMGFRNASFFTIMAYGEPALQDYRVFSNPRINYCGSPCGIAEEADNARSMGQTVPVVAGTMVSRRRGDFDGDSFSDILWRNANTGENQIWRSANSGTKLGIAYVGSPAWTIVGTGDYDGDGRNDVLWRHTGTGQNALWLGGNSTTQQAMPSVPDQNWRVAGSGDFDGDGRDDILWRHAGTGANQVWRSGNASTQLAVAAVASSAWRVAGVADFNGDGRDDLAWRNTLTGANTIWRSANNTTQQALPTVPDQNWSIAGVGDFDADGADDLLWRNASAGANQIWRSGNSTTQQAVLTVANAAWKVAAVGDFDGDGRSDVLWRNSGSGANEIWRGAVAANRQVITTVGSSAWVVEN